MNIDGSDSLPGDSETTVVVVVAAAAEVAPALLLNSLPTMFSFVTSVFGPSLIVVMNRVSLDRGIKSRVLYHFVTPSDTKYTLSSSVHAYTHTPMNLSPRGLQPCPSSLPRIISIFQVKGREKGKEGKRGEEGRVSLFPKRLNKWGSIIAVSGLFVCFFFFF